MGTLGIDDEPAVVGPDIQLDIARWFDSRKGQGADPKLVALMPLMFRTLDALYLEARKLPIVGRSGVKWREPKDKPNVFTLGLNLPSREYATLRSILALAGDLKLVLGKLKDLQHPPEIGQFIKPLYERASKFEQARHFFTHMDAPLRDYSKHAIPVPHLLDCGLQFTVNAKNNIYLIWENGTLYFSYKKKPCQVNVDKPEFNEIFNLARRCYVAIMNNLKSQRPSNLNRPDQVYPP